MSDVSVSRDGLSGDWNPTVPKTPSRMGLLLLLLGEAAIAAGVVMGVVSGLAALAAISFKLRQTCRRPPIDVIYVANNE